SPSPPPPQRGAVTRAIALAPLLACVAYVTTSTSLTLANKLIFSHSLDYPWALLSLQSVGVAVLLSVLRLARRSAPVSLPLLRQIFAPCVLFTLYIFTNARALRAVSLPVLSVLKSLAPMGIALAERALFADRIAPSTAAAMLLIVVANAVTAVTDLHYDVVGYAWAMANVVINILYVLSLRACLSNSFSPVQKTLHANLVAASLMLPIAFTTNQLLPFIQRFPASSAVFRHVFVLSSFLAAAIGISIFWLVSVTSGSTLSFLGACNKFSVVLLAALLFHTEISALGWLSIMAGVFAGVLFALSKAYSQSPVEKKAPYIADQPSTVVDMHAQCKPLHQQSPSDV
ncbi:unnamed protein product, partial [Agarophyton chilense]